MSDSELLSLADQINHAHIQAVSHATKAIDYAAKAGGLLIEAKSQVKHGEWSDWLAANCEVSERQAQRYMRVTKALEDPAKASRVSDLSLRGAMEALNKPRETKEPKLSQNPIGRAGQVIDALQDIHPGIRFTSTGLELPDDLPYEHWLLLGNAIISSGTVDERLSGIWK